MNPAHSSPASPGLFATASMERLTLLLNHVLASETVSTERLRPHAGRTLRVQACGWPSLLPALPDASFRVTPAGLLEWCGADSAATEPSLTLVIDAANPALLVVRSLAGIRPAVEVQGDAALAAEVSWLFDNLRWDVRDDLARIVGPANAERLGYLGRALANGLRRALRLVSARSDRHTG